MKNIMTYIAVCIFALTAVSIAFAQTDKESVSSETEFTTETADESATPESEAAGEPVLPKKKKNKSHDKSAISDDAVAATDEHAHPQKARDKPAAAAEEAAVKEETKFKIGGLLEAGFDIHNRIDRGDTQNRLIGRGEIEVSARPVKKVRAELGIEYDVRDTFIVVDKLYGQYNVTSDGTIRAGLMKKSFGPEERSGVDERYFHRRSIINSALEDLGFLEHDLTLLYRHDIDSTWRFSGGVSWLRGTIGIGPIDSIGFGDGTQTVSGDTTSFLTKRGISTWSREDTMSYLQNYSVQYNPTPNMTFILAAIVRHLSYSGSTTFASSLSFAHTAKPVESDAEITFGSRKERYCRISTYLDDETFNVVKLTDSINIDYYIFGARVQERFPIDLNFKTLRQIIPVAEIAAYWGDLKNGGDFDAQFRAGLVFGFAKNSAFQFRNTFSALMQARGGDTDFTRYRWDSEVVVIF